MDYPRNIFRAYDIRGIYPREINERIASDVAEALGVYFHSRKKSKQRKARVVVGRDARVSSPKLYRAVIKGLPKNKVSIVEAGLISTPMLYFLVNDLDADGGIIVTASHNPPKFNGLKIVKKYAVPIGGEEAYLIATSGITL